jgi:uncharacterized protein (UPF0548 family)
VARLVLGTNHLVVDFFSASATAFGFGEWFSGKCAQLAGQRQLDSHGGVDGSQWVVVVACLEGVAVIWLTTATLDWFGRTTDDLWLNLWREMPASFHPDQPPDPTFHRDYHQITIARNCTQAQFDHAADHLMRYHFYPRRVMTHTSDFSLNKRWAQPNDRILQRIRPFHPLVDIITMSQIHTTMTHPRKVGFSYITIATHCELGEWGIELHWLENNDLQLTMNSLSRPAYDEPRRNYPIMRRIQKWAHRQGIAHFSTLVHEQQMGNL